ncbi:hypothetical protein AB0D10_14670 [Kitasatospora sp. NPDC048545]|uniref:hypothetical protein n=1 Tax=Kitasatospora sp. NPDC048545 TaxID=3157208 RepID=UPI0033C65543
MVPERLPERSGAQKANGLVGEVIRLLDHQGRYEPLGGPDAPRPAARPGPCCCAPDGYVAWASEPGAPDPGGLTRALCTWCGDART